MGDTTKDSTTFRTLFPLLQIGTTILLFGLYFMNWRIVTPITVRTPAGEHTLLIHDFHDSSSRQVDWVQAMNFPAGWIVFPVELAATKGEGLDVGYPLYGHMRFIGFGLVGTWVWFFAGRWVDSAIAMFRQRDAILPMAGDWAFSICVSISGVLEIALESARRLYLGWGIVWVLLGCGAVLLHIFQSRSVGKAERELNSVS
jgi:hypothetical protein